jgi:hypothetical protein
MVGAAERIDDGDLPRNTSGGLSLDVGPALGQTLAADGGAGVRNRDESAGAEASAGRASRSSTSIDRAIEATLGDFSAIEDEGDCT